MRIRISKTEEIETDRESTADLQKLRDTLILEQTTLKEKVLAERQNPNHDGERYRRLIVARKRNGVAIEELKQVIKDRRTRENVAASSAATNTVDHAFVAICRERMERDLFLALIEEAKERVRQAEQEVA